VCLCNYDSGIHKLYLMSVAELVATELKTNDTQAPASVLRNEMLLNFITLRGKI